MLTFTRDTAQQSFFLQTRQREPFLTRRLLRSFCIALAVHALGFFLFRIETHDVPEYPIHLPVVVHSDTIQTLLEEGAQSSLVVDENGLLPRYILEPEALVPSLPSPSPRFLSEHLTFQKEEESTEQAFTQLKRISVMEEEEAFHLLLGQQPFSLHFSGELAEIPLRSSRKELHQQLPLRETFRGEHQIIFHVQLDRRRGEIFWSQIITPSEEQALNLIAQQLIRALRFAPSPKKEIAEGDVEITFTFRS